MPRSLAIRWILACLWLASLVGCVDRVELSKTAIGEVLDQWESGNKQQAVRQLVEIDWKDDSFEPLPSEQKQVWQSAEKQQELSERLPLLKDLAVAAMQAAEQAEADGNSEQAHEYRQAVTDMAEYLSRKEHSTTIQAMGQAVTRIRNRETPADESSPSDD